MRLEAVVQVGGVVGDFVHQIDQLRLQRRPRAQQILRNFRNVLREPVARMLDDPLPHFKGKIQAGECQVALLELFDDPQRVQIMIEPVAIFPHPPVERPFAGMAKRRMPDVVHQGERFGEVGI